MKGQAFYVIVIGSVPSLSYWAGPGRGFVLDFDYAFKMDTHHEAECMQLEFNMGNTRIEEHGYL